MNIKISKKEYDLFKEFKKELKTQNNRMTRSPLYVVNHTVKQWGMDSDYSDTFEWIYDSESYDDNEIKEFLVENYTEEIISYALEQDDEYEFDGDDDYEKAENYLNELDGYDFDNAVEKLLPDSYKSYWVERTQLYENSFSFFEKDAYDHINLNGHNIPGKDIHTFACSLQRTPRMEKLRSLLIDIKLKKGENCGSKRKSGKYRHYKR